jgi:hypothetical protein
VQSRRGMGSELRKREVMKGKEWFMQRRGML